MRTSSSVLLELSELGLEIIMRPDASPRAQRERLRVLREEAEDLCPGGHLASVTALAMVSDLLLRERITGRFEHTGAWCQLVLAQALILRGEGRALAAVGL